MVLADVACGDNSSVTDHTFRSALRPALRSAERLSSNLVIHIFHDQTTRRDKPSAPSDELESKPLWPVYRPQFAN